MGKLGAAGDINGKSRWRCRYVLVTTFATIEIISGVIILAFGAVDVARNFNSAVRFLMSSEIWAGAFVVMTGGFGIYNGCCRHRGLGAAFILMSFMGVVLTGASITISLFTGIAYTVSSGYTCTQTFQYGYILQYSCTKSGSNSPASVNVNVVVAAITILLFILCICGVCCGCCTSCRCCGADEDADATVVPKEAENGEIPPEDQEPLVEEEEEKKEEAQALATEDEGETAPAVAGIADAEKNGPLPTPPDEVTAAESAPADAPAAVNEAVEPVAETIAAATVLDDEPIAEPKEPIAEPKELIAEPKEPIAEPKELIAEPKEPIADETAPEESTKLTDAADGDPKPNESADEVTSKKSPEPPKTPRPASTAPKTARTAAETTEVDSGVDAGEVEATPTANGLPPVEEPEAAEIVAVVGDEKKPKKVKKKKKVKKAKSVAALGDTAAPVSRAGLPTPGRTAGQTSRMATSMSKAALRSTSEPPKGERWKWSYK